MTLKFSKIGIQGEGKISFSQDLGIEVQSLRWQEPMLSSERLQQQITDLIGEVPREADLTS